MLLGRLVQRRRESPGEAWLDSYAAAWREAGRPELTNVFTPQAWVLWPELKLPDSLRRAALGTPSQLLLQPDLCTHLSAGATNSRAAGSYAHVRGSRSRSL